MSVFFSDDPPGHGHSPRPLPGRRFRWLRRLLAVVSALVVVTLAAGAIYVGSVSRSFSDNISREELMPNEPSSSTSGSPDRPARPDPPAKRKGAAAVNYVLMGSDSRSTGNAGAGRSDTLIVLHLAADRKKAYLISFPRDMYVDIPGHGKNKINAAFAFGGPVLTVRTLEGLLDTRMDHVALIDFDGFIQLTNRLGGVEVNNRHASTSGPYTFPVGRITISGDQALAYVRDRYNLPGGDLDRAERQRDVVRSILRKGLSAKVIANPRQFTGLVGDVAQHVVLDQDLTDAEIRRTALSLRLGPDDIRSLQAPISGFDTVGGQSIDVVDREQLAELAEAMREGTMEEYVERYPGG